MSKTAPALSTRGREEADPRSAGAARETALRGTSQTALHCARRCCAVLVRSGTHSPPAGHLGGGRWSPPGGERPAPGGAHSVDVREARFAISSEARLLSALTFGRKTQHAPYNAGDAETRSGPATSRLIRTDWVVAVQLATA